MSYLHNWNAQLNVSKSILGMLRVKTSFFSDDGFGNMVKIDVAQSLYFLE